MEELLCRTVTKLVLPATRAWVAQTLHEKYGYTQQKIADQIGIVQVGVGKYINKKYSEEVKEVVEYIEENAIAEEIVEGVLKGDKTKDTERKIDKLCNDGELLDFAVRKMTAINRH